MKLTFECKLTMFDYIPDNAVEEIRTKEQVAEALVEQIKKGLFKTGEVSIADATLTKEGGEQNG